MKPHTNKINFHFWNRKILNAYWLVLVMSILAEAVGLTLFFIQQNGFIASIFSQLMLFPTLLMCLILLSAEVFNRFNHKYSSQVLIVSGTLMSGVLVYHMSSVDGIQMIFLLPTLASAFYFQRRKVFLSFSLNFLSFLGLYLLLPTLHMQIGVFELTETITVLFAAAIIIYGIILRGGEIQKDLIATMNDQQELLVKNVIMDKLSKMDALTDLYNHKTFHEYLDKLIEQSERHNLRLQLALFDIDNFKKINDTYGHWVGDLVLRRVSQAIRETVSTDDFAARYGGEEFAVIFTDNEIGHAFKTAEAIRRKIAETVHEELNGRNVTISIGLHPFEPGKGKEALFKGADNSLYTAKRTGKNKTVLMMAEKMSEVSV